MFVNNLILENDGCQQIPGACVGKAEGNQSSTAVYWRVMTHRSQSILRNIFFVKICKYVCIDSSSAAKVSGTDSWEPSREHTQFKLAKTGMSCIWLQALDEVEFQIKARSMPTTYYQCFLLHDEYDISTRHVWVVLNKKKNVLGVYVLAKSLENAFHSSKMEVK